MRPIVLTGFHILVKFHEDIPNSYRVMWCTRMKTTQNKDKTQTKGHYSEMEQTESNRNHI